MHEGAGEVPFGTLLRRFRQAAGLSQEALAERAGLSVEGVSALERSLRRTPRRDTLALLARALDLQGWNRVAFEAAARRTPPLPAHPFSEHGPHERLVSKERAAGNLPLELTSFVGRADDLCEIAALLETDRLVTILGTGGVGKTRVAAQMGHRLAGRYRDGVWRTDLAAIAAPEFVLTAIATTFGLGRSSGRELHEERLVTTLKMKCALLIIDNCEHVLAATAGAVEAIVRSCPDIHAIVTSREPLGVAGEKVYRLAPLSLPPDGVGITAQAALRYDAVALFADRAKVARPAFSVTDGNAPAVVELCRRLDGIAFALELAALRVRAASIEQIAERLDDRFRLLTGGSRSAPPRQQTMRAVIDWSYEMLTASEQRLLRRLSVFRGGWNLEAAGEICRDEAGRESDVLDRLAALVDKSLVVADVALQIPRFRMLYSVREYAAEKLAQAGEAEIAARRHATWCLAFATRCGQKCETTPALIWRAMVEAEIDNLRAVLRWSLEQRHDVALGGAIVAALADFWRSRQPEGRRWLELAAALLRGEKVFHIAARLQSASDALDSDEQRSSANTTCLPNPLPEERAHRRLPLQ